MFSRGKCLMVIHLLLSEYSLCRAAPPPTHSDTLLPNRHQPGAVEAGEGKIPLGVTPLDNRDPAPEEMSQSAQHLLSRMRTRLQRQIQDHVHVRGNVSCQELLSASTMDDPQSSMFPRELLGLTLVPVLVVAGCPTEAHTLVLKLYELLGAADTEELLLDVQNLIERRLSRAPSPARSETDGAGRHMEAVMFNIQQLALVGEEAAGPEGHCNGWTRVNGTKLVGTEVEGDTGRLEEAVSNCERLGVLCAGVTAVRPLTYQAVLKRGSRILPSATFSRSWIRRCDAEDPAAVHAAPRPRPRRSPQPHCVNQGEERVYNVVEWIPAVSTLYNLGTAVYYASVNCTQTAKERAILSAVDLGTDALMVATGGTAGVAGYALGAGVKTGVKAGVRYLLSSMKQEDDVLVNQTSWEDGVLTIQ